MIASEHVFIQTKNASPKPTADEACSYSCSSCTRRGRTRAGPTTEKCFMAPSAICFPKSFISTCRTRLWWGEVRRGKESWEDLRRGGEEEERKRRRENPTLFLGTDIVGLPVLLQLVRLAVVDLVLLDGAGPHLGRRGQVRCKMRDRREIRREVRR